MITLALAVVAHVAQAAPAVPKPLVLTHANVVDDHTHIADRGAARRALESGVTTVRSASTPCSSPPFPQWWISPSGAGTTTPGRSGSAARPCCRTEADLIVVGTNPLEDITALEDVQVVISNGRVALNRLPFGN